MASRWTDVITARVWFTLHLLPPSCFTFHFSWQRLPWIYIPPPWGRDLVPRSVNMEAAPRRLVSWREKMLVFFLPCQKLVEKLLRNNIYLGYSIIPNLHVWQRKTIPNKSGINWWGCGLHTGTGPVCRLLDWRTSELDVLFLCPAGLFACKWVQLANLTCKCLSKAWKWSFHSSFLCANDCQRLFLLNFCSEGTL